MVSTAVILAGGKSSRFGSPKGLATVFGRTLVGRIVEEIRKTGISDIYLSTDEPGLYSDLNLPTISDRYKGCGPLAGIHSALLETGSDNILILPCDLPGITSDEIKRLIEKAEASPEPVVFAVTGNQKHPLCSVVSRELMGEIEIALKEGRHGVQRFFCDTDHDVVHFDDESPFLNVNTPGDLLEWEVNNAI